MVPLLFANCIPVRGARRALVCDLQAEQYYVIPLALYEILTQHRGKTLDEIKALFPAEAHEVVDEYFELLFSHGLAWLCDEPERFPELDLEWDHPGTIASAIVDTGPDSDHDYASLAAQLDELGCRSLQLRFFSDVDAGRLEEAVASADGTRLRFVELLVPHSAGLDEAELRALMERHPRVQSVFVHSAPRDRVAPGTTQASRIVHRTDVVDGASHCGQVHPAYFVTNIPSFAEAQRFNSCLNRKVSVDEHGEIRNCPAMPASYGNARDTSLHSAVIRSEFREVWAVNKDQIEVCRDCEFRYVCTDCRAFIRDAGDRYSKPSKCTYDPYTATWYQAPAPGQLRAVAAAA